MTMQILTKLLTTSCCQQRVDVSQRMQHRRRSPFRVLFKPMDVIVRQRKKTRFRHRDQRRYAE